MKIALVSNSSWNVFNFRKELIHALKRRGHELYIISPTGKYDDLLADMGCNHVPLQIGQRTKNPFQELLVLTKLFFIIRTLKPSVILSFTIKPNIYCSLVARVLNINIICNVTGLGHTFLVNKLMFKAISILYKVSFQKINACFFQNKQDRALFVDRKILKNSNARLLPGSGVNTEFFKPKKRAVEGGFFVFHFIGRILEEKGIVEFINAASLLRSHDIICKVTGHLDRKFISKETYFLFHDAISKGVIEFSEFTQNVRESICNSNCVVLPSYREGASRVLLEALALTVPVIASDVPGCNNIVEHKKNGFLCEMKNHLDLYQKMKDMYELPRSERTRMGKKGREKIENQFHVNKVVDKYLIEIESIKKIKS